MTSKINFVYSDPTGVGNNNDPKKSLGGTLSSFPIMGNKIFDDVSDDDAKSGITHYRCIYATNDAAAYNVYNANLYISNDISGGASVSIGYKLANERQTVTLSDFSTITGGFLDVVYTRDTTYPITVNWDGTPATFASNFQTQLNTIDGLGDVVVTASYDGGSDIISFQIDFLYTAGNRYHEILSVDDTNLTYTGGLPNVNVNKDVSGSPINTETVEIESETTTPSGVIFGINSFDLNTFYSLDVVPIWIRRVVAPNTTGFKNDGFTLRVKGTSVP